MKNKTSVLELLSKIFFCICIGMILLGVLFFSVFRIFSYGFALIFGSVWVGIGVLFGLTALVMFLIYKNGSDKKKQLKRASIFIQE